MNDPWIFRYNYLPLSEEKEEEKVWMVQDLSESASYMANGLLKDIYHLLLLKCDHFFANKREDGTYELVLAFDGYYEDSYSRTRLDLWHELQCFTLDRIKVYFTDWEEMPRGEKEGVDLSGGESLYLNEIIGNNNLYAKFQEAWEAFPLPDNTEQDPKLGVVEDNKDEVRRVMSIEKSFEIRNVQTQNVIEGILSDSMKEAKKNFAQLQRVQRDLRLIMNASLVIIKPIAYRKGLTQDVLHEFVKRNYVLLRGKTLVATKEQAEAHYEDHFGKPWFEKITTALCSGPIYVVFISHEDPDCISNIRKLIGATDPREAEAGTIRAKYGTSVDDNVIHASDSKTSAHREKQIWAKSVFTSN